MSARLKVKKSDGNPSATAINHGNGSMACGAARAATAENERCGGWRQVGTRAFECVYVCGCTLEVEGEEENEEQLMQKISKEWTVSYDH